MIHREENLAEWALLIYHLDDAREHLSQLLAATNSLDFDETDFGIHLAEIYSHLNKAWNGRNKVGEWTDADFEAFSKFPSDLTAAGYQPPLIPPDPE